MGTRTAPEERTPRRAGRGRRKSRRRGRRGESPPASPATAERRATRSRRCARVRWHARPASGCARRRDARARAGRAIARISEAVDVILPGDRRSDAWNAREDVRAGRGETPGREWRDDLAFRRRYRLENSPQISSTNDARRSIARTSDRTTRVHTEMRNSIGESRGQRVSKRAALEPLFARSLSEGPTHVAHRASSIRAVRCRGAHHRARGSRRIHDAETRGHDSPHRHWARDVDRDPRGGRSRCRPRGPRRVPA